MLQKYHNDDVYLYYASLYRSLLHQAERQTMTSSAEPQEVVDGLQFSVVPQFELIPREALVRLVRRAELGQKIKGAKAWNALSDNQASLLSKVGLAKRLGHAIDHATKLLEKLLAGEPLYQGEDDDAAALMWAGMFACCATAAMEKEKHCQPKSSPSSQVSQQQSKDLEQKQALVRLQQQSWDNLSFQERHQMMYLLSLYPELKCQTLRSTSISPSSGPTASSQNEKETTF